MHGYGLLGTRGIEQGFRPLPDDVAKRFESTLPGAAMQAAEIWCMEHGFSIGPLSKGSPRALKRGLHCLPHWSQLTAQDRAKLHGAIIAHSVEFGPVVVRIRRRAADITLLQAS
jgi:hypothetical protein